MVTVNDESSARLSVSFYDPAGALDTPDAVTYRIDDVDSGDQIRDNTSVLTLASAITINLTPTDNTLVNAAKRFEFRRVTVTASYGVDDQVVDEYTYRVRNRRGA